MEAITRVNLTWTHPLLLSRLTQFAVLRSYAVQRFDLLTEPEHGEGEQALSYPAGHAVLLLAEAVTSGVITAEEAELIGLTRLENVQLSVYYRERNLLYCNDAQAPPAGRGGPLPAPCRRRTARHRLRPWDGAGEDTTP